MRKRANGSLQVLVESLRLEELWYLLVESGDQLVDGLFPRLLLVSLVLDCIIKVPKRLLDHLSEHFGQLFG